MKKCFLRLLPLLVLAALLGAVHAEEDSFAGRTLEGVVGAFREQYHLNEYNFAVSYYNTVTGERYDFNETKMMIAASTYKMPLNLYYYTMEQNGEIEPDAYIPGAGTTLDKAHERSLVHSDNDVSEGMLYHLGGFRQYKEKMRTFFTMTDEEISSDYYNGNYYCTRMMTDALQYLYDHADDYGEMLGYMKQANPDTYFKRLVTDYEIAHKYGSYEGSENDVGIVYTEQPFLLAVYTYNSGGEEVCAQLCKLLTEYNVYYTGVYEQEQQAQAQRLAAEEAQRKQAAEEAARQQEAQQRQEAEALQRLQEAAEALDEPEQTPQKPAKVLTWWMLAVAAFVCAIGSLGVAFIFRKPGKYEEKYRKKYAKFLEEEQEKSTVD